MHSVAHPLWHQIDNFLNLNRTSAKSDWILISWLTYTLDVGFKNSHATKNVAAVNSCVKSKADR